MADTPTDARAEGQEAPRHLWAYVDSVGLWWPRTVPPREGADAVAYIRADLARPAPDDHARALREAVLRIADECAANQAWRPDCREGAAAVARALRAALSNPEEPADARA